MKKHLSVLTLLAALLVPWVSQSQGTTINTFPWSCDFENATTNAAWSFSNSSNGWYIGTATNNGGTHSMYVSENNGSTSTYSGSGCVSYAYLTIQVSSGGQYELSFDWKCNGESTYDFLRVAVSAANTALPSSYSDWTSTSVPTNFLAVDGGSKLNLQSSWQNLSTTVTVPAAGTYRLIFVWRNDPSVYNMPPAAIDNVYINELTCPAPMNLSAVPSADQIDLSWTPGGSESQWMVVMDNEVLGYAYDTTYSVTNLTGNTAYNFKVYAVCGAGDTSMATQATFRTSCVPISTLPYQDGFEDAPSYVSGSVSYAEAFPACWTRINDATGTYNYYPYINTSASYVHSGTKGMYWYQTSTSGYAQNEYAILPPVDLDVYNISDLTLAFYAKTTSTSYHPMPIVGVMTNPTDASTFTPVYTFTSTEITTAWELYSVSLSSYTGSGAYIAIKWPNPGSTSYMAIDDIFLTDDWCNTPFNVTAASSTDEVTISWNANGGSSFTVFLGTDTITNVSDTTYTFTNLTSNTLFEYGVATECTSTLSAYIVGSIRTQCTAIDVLPYTQNFDDAATGSSTGTTFVNCMARLNNGTQYFGYPYVGGSSYNHTPGGSKGLYWYNNTTTGTYGDYQIVVLPAVDDNLYPVNTLQLRFWARPSTTSYSPVFQVGVMTNPNDATTFQTVSTVNVMNIIDWQEFTVSLANYTGAGQFVAIRAQRPTSSWYAYVDDINLEEIPTCPPLVDLEATPSVGSALLTWGYQTDVLGTPAGYVVIYDSVGSTDNPMTVNVTEPSVVLTGLVPGTTYKAYVYADCGSDGTGRMDSITFTTTSLGCAVPDPATTSTIVIGSGTTTTYYLPIGNYFNYSYTQQLITADELNGPTTISGIEFQYAYSSAMTDKTNVTIYMANVSATSLESAFVPYNASTFQQVYSGSLNCSSGWNNFTFTTPFNYDGSSNLLIVVHDNSGGYDGTAYVFNGHSATGKARYVQNDSSPYTLSSVSGGTSYATRANMKLHTFGCLVQASCAAPSVAVSDVQSDEVTLSWAPGYDETAWDVDYRVSGTTAWTNATSGTTATTYTITGLNPSTDYEFRVGFSCSDGIDYYSAVTATTSCVPAPLPYTENFDNHTTSTTSATGVMPNCWDRIMTGTSTYQTGSYLPQIYYGSANASSGSYSLRLYGVGYHMLPVMAASIDSLLLSFNVYTTSTSYKLVVGVMEGSTFVPIDTVVAPTSQHTPIEVSFAGYQGTGDRIAFYNYNTTSTTYYSYNYIDDIMVDYLPDCPRVSGITVSNITEDGATISWNGNDGSSYEVEYGHAGYTVGQGNTTIVTGTSATLTGLNASTLYDVYVREVCSSGSSVWSFVRQFRTACAAISSLPYQNGFEDDPAYVSGSVTYAEAFPACWTRINDATGTYNYYPYINTSASYVHSGTKGMYWYQTSTSGYAQNEYAILPPIDLTTYDISDLTLSFYAKTTSTSYHPMPVIGVMTDPTDASTFTPVYTFTSTEITTAWELYSVSLSSYTGSGAYIAIKWPNPGSTSYMAIDDIFLTDDWCDAPLAVAASSTTDEITVHWTPGNATSFTVVLGNDTITNVSDTSYTFTGLTANTHYNYSVASECSGATSMFVSGSIYTQCAPIDVLPYTQNFDAAATGTSSSATFVNCMNRLNNGTQYFGYPYVGGSTYNHTPGGSKGLYWYNTTTTGTYGDYQIIVMPAVDADLYPVNTLQLRFWSRPSTTSYSPVFQVGVMTDPNDATTFQTVSTVNVMNITEWQEFSVPLATYTGAGQFVAIRAQRPTSSWYAYVDDITLEEIPSCAPLSDLQASVTTTGAVLTWNTAEGYNTPDSYEVTYRALVPGASDVTVTTTDPYYVLTGLTTNTTYKVVVRADCGSDGYGRGDSVTFTPQAVSYIEIGNGTSTSYYVPLNNYYNYTYTQELILASEMNGPDTLTGIDFQYAYSSPSTAKTSVQIYLATVTQTTLSSAVPYSASTFQQVYSGHLNCTQGWNHFQFSTPYVYNGTGNLLVVVLDNSGDYDGDSYVFNTHSATNMSRHAYNDDDSYTLSSGPGETDVLSERANMRIYHVASASGCSIPRVVIGSVDTTNVTIAWAPGGDETSWDVDYRVSGADAWTSAATGISVTNYTFTGLNPATDYEFRVSYECGDGSTLSSVAIATTNCMPMTLPYSENFDALTTGTATTNLTVMPNCWDWMLTGSSTYQGTSYYPGVYYSTSYSNSGNYCLRLYGVGYFMLPEIAVDSINTLILSFNAYTTSTSYGLIVGVMENGTFVPVDTVAMTTSQHNPVEVSFIGYHGTGNRIAFRNYYTTSASTYYSYVYIDDIVVDLIPDCPRVTGVAARNITQTSATIGWIGVSDYEVEYGPMGFSLGQGTQLTVTASDSVDITGLTPNTPYSVYVREICSEGTSVWSFVYNFRTACGLIDSLPYVENFEGYTTGSSNTTSPFIPCWTRINNGTTYGGYPYLSNSSTYNHTMGGGAGLYWYGSTTTGTYGDYMYILLPEIDTLANPINTLQLSFWAKSSSTSYNPVFQVGVMNSNTDTSFYPLNTININGNTEWTEYITNLSSYPGLGGRYVAIRALRPSSSWYAYVDDVTLELQPACPRVEDLHVTYTSLDSITIAWTDTSTTNTSWVVEYGTTAFTPGTGVATPIPVTDTFYTFSGLDSATTYHIYVYPTCVDYVGYRYIQATTLAASPATVPYFCDFEENGFNGWDLFGDGQTNYWMVGSDASNGGTQSMYVTNNGTNNAYTNTSISYSYAIRTLHLADTGEYAYSYDWKGQGESHNYDFSRVFLTPASEMFTAGTVLGGSTYSFASAAAPDSWIELTQSGATPNTLAQSSVWQTVLGTFNISQPGNYKLVFVWANDGSGGSNPPTAIDNVSLMHNSCPMVEDLVANYVTIDSATLTWTAAGTHTSFVIEYDSVPFTAGNGAHIANTTGNTYDISGLSAGHTYHVVVRAECSGDTSMAASLTFTTLSALPASVPYSCTFEDAGTNGWDFINGSENNYWVVGNAVNHGGSKSMYITDNGTANNYSGSESYVFATRTFNLAAGNYISSYDWRCNGESSFDFIRVALVPASTVLTAGSYSGFNNESSMPAGAIALDGGYRMNLQSNWQTQVDEFTVTTPGTYMMVFLWRNDPSVYNQPPAAIDNVQLMLNTCPMVSNVTASLLADTISLAWTAGGSETSWEVTVGSTTAVVNTPAYVATGLTANTDYAVTIRAICAAGDTSMTFGETYHTPCVATTLPYSENFDGLTTGTATTNLTVVPSCWDYILTGSSTYQAASYYPGVYYSSSYAHSGSYSYRLYGQGYHMLPPMPTDLSDLQLTFWDYTTSTSYGLEVGVMEGNTFVPIQTINTPSSTHMQHTVYFGTYTGSSRIIAFRNYYTTSTTTYYSYHYLDNVEVDYLPTCPPVADVHAAAAGVSSISVDWIDQAPASAWQVSYSLGNATPTVITATSHPVTINGLDTLTSYNVSVRPICSATDTGSWSQPVALGTEMCDNAFAATTGTATGTSYYTPVNNYYKYTLSETIIDSAELAGIGDINAIAYSYAYSTASSSKTNVDIWLQPTNKTVFSSGSDLVLLDTTTAVKVYHGNLNCSQGWNYFQFDTIYSWDGHSNLLVIVDDNSNAYNGLSYIFNTSSSSGYKTLVWYSDTYDADPTSTSYSGTKTYYQYRATMKLISCNASLICRAPVVTSMVPVETTVTVNWTGSAADYEVALRPGNWVEPNNPTVVSGNTYTFSGLMPGTQYSFGIRAVCDAAEGLYSEWVVNTVTTAELPCPTPTNVTVPAAGITTNSAVVSWTAEAGQSQFELRYSTGGDTSYVIVNNNPATLTGLLHATTYSVSVRAICAEGVYSDWSAAATFTTEGCDPVSNVRMGAITATTATVMWNGSASAYEVAYGLQGVSTDNCTRVPATGNSHTITGLEPDTYYDVYVRAVCAEGVNSDWSAVTHFATQEGTGTYYTLTLNVNDPTMGTVSGAGTYLEGTSVTARATSNAGYHFVKWSDNVTDSVRTIVMTSDITLTATFAANVGIEDVNAAAIALYPNPASSTVTVIGIEGAATVTVVDMNGREVSSFDVQNSKVEFDVSGYAQGAYFVRITGEKLNAIRKLIVR